MARRKKHVSWQCLTDSLQRLCSRETFKPQRAQTHIAIGDAKAQVWLRGLQASTQPAWVIEKQGYAFPLNGSEGKNPVWEGFGPPADFVRPAISIQIGDMSP